MYSKLGNKIEATLEYRIANLKPHNAVRQALFEIAKIVYCVHIINYPSLNNC